MSGALGTAPETTGILLQAAVLLCGLAATLGWLAGRASTVPERRRLREQLGQDVLTGLDNRAGLARAVDTVAASAAGQPVALAIDLDGFKEINDRYGHAVGDAVLRSTAQRLRGCLRALGVRAVAVARTGGDEFAVLLVSPDGTGLDATARIAATVHRALCRPHACVVPGAAERPIPPLNVGASIGVAVGRMSGVTTWQRLLDAADAAMYVAKRSGGGWSWAGAPASATLAEPEKSAAAAFSPSAADVTGGDSSALPAHRHVRRLAVGCAAAGCGTGRQLSARLGEKWAAGQCGGDLVA